MGTKVEIESNLEKAAHEEDLEVFEEVAQRPEPPREEELVPSCVQKLGEAAKPSVQVVDELDRLKSENVVLRAINAAGKLSVSLLQLQQQVHEKTRLEQELGKAQAAAYEFQVFMARKYNIDFNLCEIEEGTGRVVPRRTQ